MTLEAGSIIDGRYRLKTRVGSGGMADVWCAEDLQLGRDVALKLLHQRFATDEEFVERFRREASAAGGLQHPNVVQIYDRGEHDGVSYIAMEFLAGRSLKQIVVDDAPLPPARAIDLVEQILRAARFAHKRGIIHRDLKPHNVIVDSEGRAKVTDFGIARAGASDMTETGSIMGTAQYLSPEQAQGQPTGAPSDLYSVGIILYELLTGRVPFEGDSAVAIALKQVNENPLPPSHIVPSIPAPLEQVVLHAMQKDPGRRFADADAFLAALEQARGALPISAAGYATGELTQVITGPLPTTPVAPGQASDAPWFPAQPLGPPPPRERRGDRRNGWIALGVGVLVAAAVVLALVLVGGGKQTEVPDLVGSSEAAAKQALARRGLQSDVSRQESSTAPVGQVIGQEPGGGGKVDEGGTVQLTISSGPAQVRIPDVRGDGRNSARRQLQQLGLEVVEREQDDDSIGENRVIETSPAIGTQVSKGEQITLVISNGAERVVVPKAVDAQREDAEDALRQLGLTVEINEQDSTDKEPGVVLAQDPAAGSRVRKGSTVTLTVAQEPEEIDVPDVVGDSQAAATERLSGAGFTVRVANEEVDNPTDDGVVLSITPTGKRMRGSTVTITVGTFDPDLDPDPTGTTTSPAPTPTTPTPTTTTPAP